ncbi:hypothetical protein EDD22DRAFT_960138 [Suillus occidentalis]|nr:hypothetical protein EDD22DRAFT_960138 [Suillus occidentalis]
MALDGRLKMGKGMASPPFTDYQTFPPFTDYQEAFYSPLPPSIFQWPLHTYQIRRQLTDSQIIPPLLAPTDPITFAALVPSAPPTEPITFAALVTSVHPALITSAPPRSHSFCPSRSALIPSTPPAALVFGFCAVHAPTLCFDLAVHLFHAH